MDESETLSSKAGTQYPTFSAMDQEGNQCLSHPTHSIVGHGDCRAQSGTNSSWCRDSLLQVSCCGSRTIRFETLMAPTNIVEVAQEALLSPSTCVLLLQSSQEFAYLAGLVAPVRRAPKNPERSGGSGEPVTLKYSRSHLLFAEMQLEVAGRHSLSLARTVLHKLVIWEQPPQEGRLFNRNLLLLCSQTHKSLMSFT